MTTKIISMLLTEIQLSERVSMHVVRQQDCDCDSDIPTTYRIVSDVRTSLNTADDEIVGIAHTAGHRLGHLSVFVGGNMAYMRTYGEETYSGALREFAAAIAYAAHRLCGYDCLEESLFDRLLRIVEEEGRKNG